jgi:hypothetical protein
MSHVIRGGDHHRPRADRSTSREDDAGDVRFEGVEHEEHFVFL